MIFVDVIGVGGRGEGGESLASHYPLSPEWGSLSHLVFTIFLTHSSLTLFQRSLLSNGSASYVFLHSAKLHVLYRNLYPSFSANANLPFWKISFYLL